jgi:hypothetical protein
VSMDNGECDGIFLLTASSGWLTRCTSDPLAPPAYASRTSLGVLYCTASRSFSSAGWHGGQGERREQHSVCVRVSEREGRLTGSSTCRCGCYAVWRTTHQHHGTVRAIAACNAAHMCMPTLRVGHTFSSRYFPSADTATTGMRSLTTRRGALAVGSALCFSSSCCCASWSVLLPPPPS